MDARVWLKRSVAVVAVLLLAYFGIGYLGEFSKIRVIANNENDWPVSAYAQLNESNHFVPSERVTIAPHSRQVVATWLVAAGSHEVYVAWSDRSVLQSYYLMPFTTKNVVVDTDVGSW
jgi:hypothetical protein